MREFDYKEIDEEGKETLETIAAAVNFNKWMFDTISPFCNGSILEIGSGIGNISQFFFAGKKNIHLSDIRKHYRDTLAEKFKQYKPEVLDIDLVDKDFEYNHPHLLNNFETVFALNVVEHIENESLAMHNCKKMLKQDGRIIILVPAYEILYNRFDKELGHHRRYDKRMLNNLLSKHFEILYSQYFNMAGIVGWYLSGSVMKKKVIPKKQMKLYDSLIPLFKIIDKIIFNSAGLSVISVGKKI